MTTSADADHDQPVAQGQARAPGRTPKPAALKPVLQHPVEHARAAGGTRRILAQSIGVRVSATKPEMITDPATAMPNSLNSRPVEPLRKASGVKTATSEMVVASTAKAISRVPLVAASSGLSSSSSWCR